MKRPRITARREITKSATGRESVAKKAERAAKIIAMLKTQYPEAECALCHESPLQLLVATILSAQCTDDRVNKVTPALFERYRTARDFADAKQEELEKLIQSTGFFRNKAKNIIGAGRRLTEGFGGDVPQTMDELLTLPGVARKTANVVLGSAFGKNEGVVVDTHIGRLSHRLGLSWRSKNDKDAVKIERDLMEIVPRDEWTYLGHALIWHGRKICTARKPNCEGCVLNALCPSAFSFENNQGLRQSPTKVRAAKLAAIKPDKASSKPRRR